MEPKGTLLLSHRDAAALLSLNECIGAVEQAFKSHAEGGSLHLGMLEIHARDGAFHLKSAGLELTRPYFDAKVNGNFFQKKQRFGMPNIQGVIVLLRSEVLFGLHLQVKVDLLFQLAVELILSYIEEQSAPELEQELQHH
jgi:hypothetical protein